MTSAPEPVNAFSGLPRAISVITTSGEHGPVGCTAGTVAPVLPRPATLSVSLSETSATLAALLRSGRFAVNVLAAHDRHLSVRFATLPGPERFTGLDRHEMDGVPVLSRSCLLLTCSLGACLPVADHRIVVGTVLSVARRPLLPAVQYRRSPDGTAGTAADRPSKEIDHAAR